MAPEYTGKTGRVCSTGWVQSAAKWRSITRVVVQDYRIDFPTVEQQVAFRLYVGHKDHDGYEFSYQIGLRHGAWHFRRIPDERQEEHSKGGRGLGVFNTAFIDSEYVAALPPARRLPIGELYGIK
jgi:hypothetical protein